MITFKNDGLIDFELITMFGVSIKEKTNPIGFFGTGLKNAIAVLLRNGQTISMYRNGIYHDFFVRPIEIRGTTVEKIHMSSPDGGLPLPFSIDLGQGWSVWQAVREIYCNALDEPGFDMFEGEGHGSEDTTSFTLGGDQVDGVTEYFSNYFLPKDKEPDAGDSTLEIFWEKPELDVVYYNGVQAHEPHKAPNWTYNIKTHLTLTEDRNIAYDFQLKRVISTYLKTAPVEFLAKFLDSAEDSFESTISLDGIDEEKVLEAYALLGKKTVGAHKEAQNIYRRHKTPSRALSFTKVEKDNFTEALDWLKGLGLNVLDTDIEFKELNDEDVVYEGGIVLNNSVVDEQPSEIAIKILYGLCMKEYDVDRHNSYMAEHVINLLWENK